MGKKTSRRNFIKLATASTLAAGLSADALASFDAHLIHPNEQQPQPASANNRIRFATIGVGIQGTADTNAALGRTGPSNDQIAPNPLGANAEVVAAADLYDGRLTRAQEVWGKQLFTTRDYQQILARSDVDAVIIATSDHWHSQIAIDAMKAGKDVYLEKPMVQSLDEGDSVIRTARETNRILQVGSQRVSSIVYRKAKELYNSGAIGQLTLVEAWWNRNNALGAWQYTLPTDASPRTVDWERFQGKAKKAAFDPVRFFRWRNYRDYGTGVAGDLFVHLFSGLHFILGSNGPTKVMATGGLRYWKDGRDVPDVMLGIYEYPQATTHPAFNLSLKVNFVDGGGGEEGFRFVGSEGVMTIGRGVTITRKPLSKDPGVSTNTFPKAMQEAIQKEYRAKYPENLKELNSTREEVYLPPQGYSDQVDHLAAFFEAVRMRRPVVEDVVFGFRAAGPALLTNLSYFNGRSYGWDPQVMKITSTAS